MEIVGIVFQVAGSLALFLYGMKVMSDGIQQTAGARLQKVLGFMTGHRLAAVLTGFGVTAIIQSSSATTVMVVSFVNAGLLNLTQAIGVIMGANIGTTVTAWIVSLVGFSLNVSSLAIPAVGIGFVMYVVEWKRRQLGIVFLGFGLLFLGLDFLTKSMPVFDPETLDFISSYSNMGILSTLLGIFIGLVMTLLIHSSSASTAIMITMAHEGVIPFHMAAAMILGAHIGTTIDAALAALGSNTAAKRAALAHVLFNVFGTVWMFCFFRPLCSLVDFVTPGSVAGPAVTNHLAMFHTISNLFNTVVFFPFVMPFSRLVSFLVKDGGGKKAESGGSYRLVYRSGSLQNAPEFNVYRAEKEIRDMAGIAYEMYSRFTKTLKDMSEENVNALLKDLFQKEAYADEMREQLHLFLIECTRHQLNYRSERNVGQMLRIIADLEDMTDDCYSVGLILERCVSKGHLFDSEELEELTPYTSLVEDFLEFVKANLGRHLSPDQSAYAEGLESLIDESRNKLRKLGRKRIEAGKDVKTEILFIDLVRRVEKLGDYCYNISEALQRML